MTTPKDEKGAEPVAILTVRNGNYTLEWARPRLYREFPDGTPLYTHPPGELDSARVREAHVLLEYWVNDFADCLEGGEGNELVIATRAALTSLKGTEP